MKLAKVESVDQNSGLTLLVDGETSSTTKKYKYLNSYVPAENDRVVIDEISGSYVVIGKITNDYTDAGNVRTASEASHAAEADHAARADTASACTGNAATATVAQSCNGNAASANRAAVADSCTGNAATATRATSAAKADTADTAAACSGNAATATVAASCSGNAKTCDYASNGYRSDYVWNRSDIDHPLCFQVFNGLLWYATKDGTWQALAKG